MVDLITGSNHEHDIFCDEAPVIGPSRFAAWFEERLFCYPCMVAAGEFHHQFQCYFVLADHGLLGCFIDTSHPDIDCSRKGEEGRSFFGYFPILFLEPRTIDHLSLGIMIC